MSSAHDRWAEYKQQVIEALAASGFSYAYGDLKRAKPSGDGWMLACCPFHDDATPSFGFNTKTGQWNCFSGCGKGDVFGFLMRSQQLTFNQVMSGLGTELGFSLPGADATGEVTYDYVDENGTLLFQVVRKHPKKFAQRQPDGDGGWIWSLKGVERVLYRLPDLVNQPDAPVYIVEGEKDADRLAGLGLVATTSPGGAGKWHQKYTTVLMGRDVVILPDNDAPGREHAAQIARSLSDDPRSAKVVKLPGVPLKGDVSDWLDAGGDRGQLEALVEKASPYAPGDQDTTASQYPVIETHDRPLREILDDTWSAVLAANDPPQVFDAAGSLVRLRDFGRGPQIEHLEERATISLLARSADWANSRGNNPVHAKPPKEAAGELIVNPHCDLPKLDSVIATPVFDRDWRLITEPGYHPEARLWLHQIPDSDSYSISDRPTAEEVQAALSLILDDLLFDFPFTADSDRTHAVAAILLPFARRMFDGPTPIHLIEAPTPGSGKSLLAELISIIALGSSPGCTTLTANEEESRKKLTAILSRGASIISIDNLQGGLWSAQVAAAITAEAWEDRLLGKTQMVTFPNRALWLVSANNPKLSMEIARRCVRIRIDPGDERPWQRTGFKHDPIREWALQNRHKLVTAILTLIQHWVNSDAPHASQPMGSFESWSRVIGGMVTHFGLDGFLGDMDEFYETADPESGEWKAFVDAWWDMSQDAPVSASELLHLAIQRDLITFAYAANSDHAQRIRFGKSLSGLRDRRFGDWRVALARDSHRKTQVFRLVPVTKELLT